MNAARSSLTVLTLLAATTLTLGACTASKPHDSAASPSAAASTPSPSASTDTVPTVPGYRPGEIPPVPLFTVPSMDVFASNADKAVIETASSLQSVPGITVSPAKCDGNVLISGSTVFGGDGSGNYTIGKTTIYNNKDGSGSYSDGTLSIINYGDGTALVNGVTITDVPKVEPLPALGKFPPVESLKPVESCGTVITLEDGILFDFGKSDIRPDAAQTLSTLATVLNNAKVPTAHIYGHTDSVSDEAFNQKLSEDRANAVKNELSKNGVSATLDATGYGETKPVAPNENPDGSDNPAGRALNRRVEIYIPAF